MSKFAKIIITVFLVFSCSQIPTLNGAWENEEKIIFFDSTQRKFLIINKNANEVIGIAGTYDIDVISKNVTLTYLYLINSNKEFFSIEDENLEKFYDFFTYKIENQTLELHNYNLDKSYFLTKSAIKILVTDNFTDYICP